MSDSQTVKKDAMLAGRVSADFKKRFAIACAMTGWSVQTALERVLGPWVDETLRGQSKPGGFLSAPAGGAWEGVTVNEGNAPAEGRKRARQQKPKPGR